MMMHFVNAEVFLLVYDLQIELPTITIDNDGPLACYDSKLWKGTVTTGIEPGKVRFPCRKRFFILMVALAAN